MTKWFRSRKNSGELFLGNNPVQIQNGDAVDHSMNDGKLWPENHVGYGKLQERGSLSKESKTRSKRNLMTGTIERIPQTNNEQADDVLNQIIERNFCISTQPISGKDRDCLDTTFETIESYTCTETSDDIFPNGSPSPIHTYQHPQNPEDIFEGCGIEITHDRMQMVDGGSPSGREEVYGVPPSDVTNDQGLDKNRSKGRSGIGFGFLTAKIGDVLLRRDTGSPEKSVEVKRNSASKSLSSTLDTSEADSKQSQISNEDNPPLSENRPSHLHHHPSMFDSFSGINRENSLLDLESRGEGALGITNSDRLEKLRQNKREIETRVNFHQTGPQTTSCSEDGSGDEYSNEDTLCMPISALPVGSYVSKEQEEKFQLYQIMLFIGTVFLAFMGLIVLVIALFWPGKLL